MRRSNDLPWRVPAFGQLLKLLNTHVAAFAKELEFDLKGRKLVLDSLWINILPPGGVHTSHIHPHSVVSGTYYVTIPDGASALKFEDPRLGFMMAAPPRKAKAKAGEPAIRLCGADSPARCCSGKAGCATRCR